MPTLSKSLEQAVSPLGASVFSPGAFAFDNACSGSFGVSGQSPGCSPPPNIQLEKKGVSPQSQESFWETATIWRNTIVAKLREAGRYDLSEKLNACHSVATKCLCLHCGHKQTWWNRCDRFYCPTCTRKLANERRKSIEAWTKAVSQPKHVVLTARNTQHFSRTYVRWFKAQLHRLLRSRLCRDWAGGIYSLEVTNEGRGWHLHVHLLVSCPWIDARHLAQKWGNLLTQDCAIVKVCDLREKSYLQEVTKYAVKGNELAQWSGKEIATFIDALSKSRAFGAFGTCYKLRSEMRATIEELTKYTPECPECTSTALRICSEAEAEWIEATTDLTKGASLSPFESKALQPDTNLSEIQPTFRL